MSDNVKVSIFDSKPDISIDGKTLLGRMSVTVGLNRGKTVAATLKKAEFGGKRTLLEYDADTALSRLSIEIAESDGVALFSISAVCSGCLLAAEHTVDISFDYPENAEINAAYPQSPWWTLPQFTSDPKQLRDRLQSMQLKLGDSHAYLLPLTGDVFRSELDSTGVHLTVGAGGYNSLGGVFLAAAVGTEPYEPIDRVFKTCRKAGAIRVPLRDERAYPDIFNYFGFCSWNAFYHDVTSDKLYSKLDEFKAKGVPVKWIIIDDGWSTVEANKLASFKEDKYKFPEGLKATVERIKGEYGVEKVGVWHAFNGYWGGVAPGSEVYNEMRDNLTQLHSGEIVPSLDPEKAYIFWNAWHSYLRGCGIDFLKVDNQGSYTGIIEGNEATAYACRNAHAAIERSISENFGGCVIDCMGMLEENILARPMSAVSRNSDDFFPERARGFALHCVQNVYNTPWHSQLHYCDFDMWWSTHESAAQSGVLRAISGGPVYVSDALGRTDETMLRPIMDGDGRLYRFDDAAKPSYSCAYADCEKTYRPLIICNRAGENIGVAAYNLSNSEVTGRLEITDLPFIDPEREYIGYEYFTKSFFRFDKTHPADITLAENKLAAYSLYPIAGGAVRLGDTSKYFSCATDVVCEREISELI